MHRDIQVVVETIKGDPNAKLPLDWPRNEDPYATSDEANNQTALAGATRRNNNNNNKDSKPGAIPNSQIDLPVAPSLSVADLLSVATPPPAVSNQHALSLMSLSEHARSLQHTSGQNNFTGSLQSPAASQSVQVIMARIVETVLSHNRQCLNTVVNSQAVNGGTSPDTNALLRVVQDLRNRYLDTATQFQDIYNLISGYTQATPVAENLYQNQHLASAAMREQGGVPNLQSALAQQLLQQQQVDGNQMLLTLQTNAVNPADVLQQQQRPKCNALAQLRQAFQHQTSPSTQSLLQPLQQQSLPGTGQGFTNQVDPNPFARQQPLLTTNAIQPQIDLNQYNMLQLLRMNQTSAPNLQLQVTQNQTNLRSSNASLGEQGNRSLEGGVVQPGQQPSPNAHNNLASEQFRELIRRSLEANGNISLTTEQINKLSSTEAEDFFSRFIRDGR